MLLPRVKNVFFIQRAAIDVLLMHQATAIEICVYLVICKCSDRYGYYSGVGYRVIKQRLRMGQRKVSEAVNRLLSMQYEGTRLLYSFDEWVFLKHGTIDDKKKVGWVIGWFESIYKHHVWLSNQLVGYHKEDERPLAYFSRVSGKDNHARMLLLLFKYHNRQYSGVNFRFISKTSTEIDYLDANNYLVTKNINGYSIKKNKLDSYHISLDVLKGHGLPLSYKESESVVNDLLDQGFISMAICVLGKHDGPLRPSKVKKTENSLEHRKLISTLHRTKSDSSKKHVRYDHDRTDKNRETWEKVKEFIKHHVLTQILAYEVERNTKKYNIRLIKRYKKMPLDATTPIAFTDLDDLHYSELDNDSKYIYKLDHKPKALAVNNQECLAGKIESLITSCGLEPASRNKRFYDKYWWIDPNVLDSAPIGIIVPTHIPPTRLPVYKEINKMFTNLKDADATSLTITTNTCPGPSPFEGY